MKSNRIVICLFLLIHALASVSGSVSNESIFNAPYSLVIDETDTIFIDVNNAFIEDQTIEIPIWFLSDEEINALDFSIKLNTENLIYESIDVKTENIQTTAFFNENDKKLRFSSNDFNPYPSDGSVIVTLKFTIIGDAFLISDLEEVSGFLNGSECSAFVTGNDIILNNENIPLGTLNIYPNPASDIIIVESGYDGEISVIGLDGQSIIRAVKIREGQKAILSIGDLSAGFYFLHIHYDTGHFYTEKIHKH